MTSNCNTIFRNFHSRCSIFISTYLTLTLSLRKLIFYILNEILNFARISSEFHKICETEMSKISYEMETINPRPDDRFWNLLLRKCDKSISLLHIYCSCMVHENKRLLPITRIFCNRVTRNTQFNLKSIIFTNSMKM